MVLLLKLTLFGVVLSLLYGWLFEFMITRLFKLNVDYGNRFSITILLGVSFLAGLLGIWSFFARIDLATVRVFSITAVVLLILLWKYSFSCIKVVFGQLMSLGPLSWLFLIAFMVYALYLASASDVTYDTGLYHAQSIRWIETYPVVKGIANIHDRLGFNSNLFLLAAFWGSAYKGEHAYQVPGLVIFFAFLVFCLYIIEKSRRNFKLSGIVAAGFLVYLLVEKGLIVWFASPTADLSAAFLTWIIFLLAAEKMEQGTSTKFDCQTAAIVMLGFFDITVKLSTAPIVIMPICFLLQSQKKISLWKSMIILILAFLPVLAWVIRNIFISGYLVFPFYQLDVFNVDWKVPLETTRYTAEVVTAWGRIPYEELSVVMSLSFGQWLPRWYQTLPPADSFLIISIVGLSIAFMVFIFLNDQASTLAKQYTSIYLVLIFGAVYWFIQSPSPRFGYGFLVTLFLFLIAPFVSFILQKIKLPGNGLMLLMQLLLIGYTAYSMNSFSVRSWKHYLNSYKPYPAIKMQSVQVDDTTIFVPLEGDQCWYDAFPCAPFEPSELSLRGAKIEDGFYVKGK